MYALGLWCVSWLGCNAILGIEPGEVDPGTMPPGQDGPTETTTTGDGSPDGNADALAANDADASPMDAANEADVVDASLPLLTCTAGAMPRVLENAANGFEHVALARIPGKGARVIATKRTVSGFTVLTYEIGGNAAGSDFPPAGHILQIERIPGAFAILTFNFIDPSRGDVNLWTVDDATDAVVVRPLSDSVDLPPGSPAPTGAFVRMGADDYLFAISYGDEATPNTSLIVAGRRKAADPIVDLRTAYVARGLTGGRGTIRAMTHAGTRAYIFDDNAPSQGSATATRYYDIPDTGILPGIVAPATVGAAGGRAGFLVTSAESAVTTTYTAAAASIDLGAASTMPARLHVGDVPPAKLAAFAAEDLGGPTVFTSIGDIPFGPSRNGSVFIGNQLLTVAAPPAGMGVNFLWYDRASGGVRARNGSANRLLPTRSPRSDDRVAIAFKSDPAVTPTQLDLVWTEAPDPDAGAARQLSAIDVTCVP